MTQSLFDVPKERIEISRGAKTQSLKEKTSRKLPPRIKPAKQKIQPVEEILFRVEGKMSTFGGPKDTGMSADEGLALFTQADLQNPKYSYLFLPDTAARHNRTWAEA